MITAADIAQGCGNARREGDSYRCRCPLCDEHTNGDRNPSFSVKDNPDSDKPPLVRCHAIHAEQQERIIDALRAKGLWPSNGDGIGQGQKAKGKPDYELVTPIPANAPDPNRLGKFLHDNLGAEGDALRFDYRDAQGKWIYSVWRLERSGGKLIRPATLWRDRNSGRLQWRSKWPDKLSLYHLEHVVAYPQLPKLLLEGENKTDQAEPRLKGHYVAVSLCGGAKAFNKNDLTPLASGTTFCWPDHDADGFDAMLKVGYKLAALKANIKIIKPDKEWPPKHDIADLIAEGWDTDRLIAYVETNAVSVEDFKHYRAERFGKEQPKPVTDDISAIIIPAACPVWTPPSPTFVYNRFDPKAMLQEVKRRFAYLKTMDNVADLDDYIIRNMDGFSAYTAKFNAVRENRKSGKWEKVNTATEWRECPARIELVKPVYEPGLPFPICEINGELYFNLWRGFAAEPKEGSVELMMKVVDHVFEGLPHEREHTLRFHAYSCQHPGEKLMHAVLLINRLQGSGKSLLGEVIGYGLWGERNFSEVQHEHLGTTFNTYLEHKKFVLANEMLLSSSTMADKRQDANTIKNAITRDRVEINPKHIRQYFVRDVLCWMLTSNFDDAVWLDREDDRRLHISRLRQQMPLSEKYGPDFAAEVKTWAQSPEGAAAIHYFFLHYDCGNFAAKAAPPVTEGQRIVYEMSLSTLERFVRDLIENVSWQRGRDLVRLDEIRKAFNARYPKTEISDQAIASAVSRFNGCYISKKLQWTDESTGEQREARVWALRNAEHWQTTTPHKRVEHYCNSAEHLAPRRRKKRTKVKQ